MPMSLIFTKAKFKLPSGILHSWSFVKVNGLKIQTIFFELFL